MMYHENADSWEVFECDHSSNSTDKIPEQTVKAITNDKAKSYSGPTVHSMNVQSTGYDRHVNHIETESSQCWSPTSLSSDQESSELILDVVHGTCYFSSSNDVSSDSRISIFDSSVVLYH